MAGPSEARSQDWAVKPIVDIVVRAKDGHQMTRECLTSIRQGTPGGTYRLILVDDGSDPAHGDGLTDVYIRSRTPSGAVTATNIGLGYSLATSEAPVLILDNDTLIPQGDKKWLERMVAHLREFPKTGAVGAVTNYASLAQHVLSAPTTYAAEWSDKKTGAHGMKDNPPVVAFVSFAVLLDKEAIRECGLWDVRYNPGQWEDTDYSCTMRLVGWNIRVATSVYIEHRGHQTFKRATASLFRDNGKKMIEKWGRGRLEDLGLKEHLPKNVEA